MFTDPYQLKVVIVILCIFFDRTLKYNCSMTSLNLYYLVDFFVLFFFFYLQCWKNQSFIRKVVGYKYTYIPYIMLLYNTFGLCLVLFEFSIIWLMLSTCIYHYFTNNFHMRVSSVCVRASFVCVRVIFVRACAIYVYACVRACVRHLSTCVRHLCMSVRHLCVCVCHLCAWVCHLSELDLICLTSTFLKTNSIDLGLKCFSFFIYKIYLVFCLFFIHLLLLELKRTIFVLIVFHLL